MLRPAHEDFLHFVWYYQYFDQNNLKTTTGAPIKVIDLGYMNADAGPDFAQGIIQIGDQTWVGDIEIHILSGDWLLHQHHTDTAYNKVILHIVWEDNKTIHRQDGTEIPTLVLKGKVDLALTNRYKALFHQQDFILCQNHWRSIPALKKIALMDRALFHRLERKSSEVLQLFEDCQEDWEQTALVMLFQSFGMKVNREAFGTLGKEMPVKILYKHKDQLYQIEALLLGQAGFLQNQTQDPYHTQLRNEYLFFQKKYKLTPIATSHWKFSRLRPYNFPTVRLAQLAQVMTHPKTLFSRLVQFKEIKELRQLLSICPSSYWQTHYHFDKKFGKKSSGKIGKLTQDSIIINAVIPLLVAYAYHLDQPIYQDKAIQLLEQLPAEQNKLTKQWAKIGLSACNAFETQAMIEQYNSFCQAQTCLKCSIGATILNKNE